MNKFEGGNSVYRLNFQKIKTKNEMITKRSLSELLYINSNFISNNTPNSNYVSSIFVDFKIL